MSNDFNSKKWKEFRISLLKEETNGEYVVPLDDYGEYDSLTKEFTEKIYPLINKWIENFKNLYKKFDGGSKQNSLNEFAEELYKLISKYELDKLPTYKVPE